MMKEEDKVPAERNYTEEQAELIVFAYQEFREDLPFIEMAKNLSETKQFPGRKITSIKWKIELVDLYIRRKPYGKNKSIHLGKHYIKAIDKWNDLRNSENGNHGRNEK